jgi:DNA-directed RNA polymerase subunit RPC12/RpoP
MNKELTLEQAMSDKGYINYMKCRGCQTPLGFKDEDVKFVKHSSMKQKDDRVEWDWYGYIECPYCGKQTLVRVERTDILRRWLVARYDTVYKYNQEKRS